MNKKIKKKEKRKYGRLDFQLQLNLNKKDKSRTKNISAGGLRFTSAQKLKPGSKVDLKIDLPNRTTPVNFKGKVVWSKTLPSKAKSKKKTYDIGVKFTDKYKVTVKYLRPSGKVVKAASPR